MAFNIKNSLLKIQAYLNASGYLSSSQIGEPKSPPQAGEQPSGSIFMQNVAIAEISLDGSTTEVHTVMVRIYKHMFSEPEEQIEFRLAELIASIVSDLLGDADLGSEVRNISVGQHGASISAVWGYLEVGGVNFRIVDLQIPLIVDGSATATP